MPDILSESHEAPLSQDEEFCHPYIRVAHLLEYQVGH